MSARARQRRSTVLPKKPKFVEFGAARKASNEKKEVEEKESQEKLMERRSNILNELFRTETSYVEYLQVAITIFYHPIQSANVSSRAYIPEGKLEQVFQNIVQLQDINAKLLKKMALRKAQHKGEFDGVWLDLLKDAFAEPELKEAYQKYMHGYDHSANTLAKLSKRSDGKNTTFGNWVQSTLTKNSDLCRGLANLPAFLICPVQRLPRYLLILRDLQKCTPEDHPDYPNLQAAFSLIKDIVGDIDKGKTRYDELYRLQGLYERFTVAERPNVQELVDPSSILITEGPILLLDTVSNSFQLRHFILLSHMLICAKKKKDNFSFKWKVDLYKCIINYHENGDGVDDTPYIIITELSKGVGDSLTTEVSHTFFTFSEEGCEYNYEFWRDRLYKTQTNLLDVPHISLCANEIVNNLQPELLLKRDWDLLAVGAQVTQYSKGDTIITKGADIQHLYFINSGRCSVEDRGQVIAALTDNDFYGESHYLKMHDDEKSEVILIAESEKVSITKISFDRLTSMLSGNTDLAKRFFHVVNLVAARYYLERASRSLTIEISERVESKPKVEEKQLAPPSPEPTQGDKTPTLSRNKKIHPALVKLKLEEIAPDEEVLQEYSCKLKKTKFSGQFYVMKEYIGFYSNVLGKKTRLVVPGRSVTEVVARDDYCIYINNLKHNVGPFELQFKSQEQKQEAYTILASFLSDKKRSLAAKTGLSFTAPGAKKGTSLFAFTEKIWQQVITRGEEFTLDETGDVLTQGFMNDAFYQVTDGELVAYVTDPITKETQILDILLPGSIFGEIPFLLGLASNVSIEPRTKNASVISIQRHEIEQLIALKPEFAAPFYKFLARICFSRFQKLELADQVDALSGFKNWVNAPLLDLAKLQVPSSPLPKSPAFMKRKKTHSALRTTDPITISTESESELTADEGTKEDSATIESSEDVGNSEEVNTISKPLSVPSKSKKSPRSPRSPRHKRRLPQSAPDAEYEQDAPSESPPTRSPSNWVTARKKPRRSSKRVSLQSSRNADVLSKSSV